MTIHWQALTDAALADYQPPRSQQTETTSDHGDIPEPDWAAVRLAATIAAAQHEPPPMIDDYTPALWKLRHEAEVINGRHGTHFTVYEPEPSRFRINHGAWTTGEPVSFAEAAQILRGITAGLGITQHAA
ncbi:hypothetical protein A5780_19300 [Nocardia sp. 852002-20019_SCH5090214]|uniref:hypothetical protein n=1 Tax=Nocardia sp. 852002-20019_SCH5090214 TaxID=1834087 RepID=UPI0007EB20C8|nr:hypothetical protein [Nocardia sp. 852002-20019_SCH5090214]OBA62206.1 hypothetical protein A5780_19300 [Nocardia sp. 852002-20019_SCH5090214]